MTGLQHGAYGKETVTTSSFPSVVSVVVVELLTNRSKNVSHVLVDAIAVQLLLVALSLALLFVSHLRLALLDSPANSRRE